MNWFSLLPNGLIIEKWVRHGASPAQLEDALWTRWWEWSAAEAHKAYHYLTGGDIQDFLDYVKRTYPYHYISAGQHFGELVVIKGVIGSGSGVEFECKCKCSCGKIIHVHNYDLLWGRVWSCGCFRDCLTLRPLYNKWRSMIARCNNPKDSSYKNYGARGIKVCKEWENFFIFEQWGNLNGYTPGLTIDRVDNNGDYTPENCRWATPKEQARNKRNTKNITYRGKTQCIAAWEEELGLPRNVIWSRLNNNWSIEKALTTEY